MHSETIGKLVEALAKVQHKIQNPTKNADNPYFRSKYADLPHVWDSCKKLLNENGLVVMQTMRNENDAITVYTILAHTSGEWVRSALSVTPKQDKDGFITAQAIGSAITYARRYALSAIVGITPDDDDDGAVASGTVAQQAQKNAPKVELNSNVSDQSNEHKKASPAQIKYLKTLALRKQVDIKALLQYLGVKSMEDVLFTEVDKAKKWIEEKANERGNNSTN